MKHFLFFILAFIISCSAFSQTNQSASTASIEHLLEVTETKEMYAATMEEMSRMIDHSTAGIMARLPADKQARFKRALEKLDGIIQDEMSWEKMSPFYVQLYAETFTQQEVDDLLAFYQTPSGKAFIRKQPIIIQKTAALSQEKMHTMMERFSQMMEQSLSGTD